jgi:hypothetical protein
VARIRTIKPEFPQSESMGRVSRDARLLFIQLWTLADDSGRLRGSSRMLASLLFPYDDDAKDLMEGWLSELSSEGCICRYLIGSDHYIELCNWLKHQKIDKPSPSKIPASSEASQIVREDSRAFAVGSRIKDQGPVPEDQGPTHIVPGKPATPDCPHQEIIDLYHQEIPTGTQVRIWNDARRKHLQARWREDADRQSLDWWRKFFAYCARSPFLAGQVTPSNGRAQFVIGLDWIVNPNNFAKIVEGKYHEASA